MSDERHDSEKHKHKEDEVAVSVITPAGVYPDEQDYRKASPNDRIKLILDLAAEKLKLKNTQDWVVRAHGREINPDHTFSEEHLKEIVEIEWHKREGGGGA